MKGKQRNALARRSKHPFETAPYHVAYVVSEIEIKHMYIFPRWKAFKILEPVSVLG